MEQPKNVSELNRVLSHFIPGNTMLDTALIIHNWEVAVKNFVRSDTRRKLCLVISLLIFGLAFFSLQSSQAQVARPKDDYARGSWFHSPPPLPIFKLPYSPNETVYWTGGPHEYSKGGQLGEKYPAGLGSGLDFASGSNPNFEVRAMAAGNVEDASCGHNGFGCQIAIRHDYGGSVLVYAHLKENSFKVGVGHHVSQGQPIAQTGNTGGLWPIHLHIELRDGGNCGRYTELCVKN